MNITHLTGMKTGSRERVRELIRIRDNWACQICGKKWVKGQRRFDIHHKDCKKEKTRQCDNYEKEKDNMITLCHKCHLNIPEHRKAMSNAMRVCKINKIKIKKIKRLRQQKLTFKKIGTIFGVSKQRIYQLSTTKK